MSRQQLPSVGRIDYAVCGCRSLARQQAATVTSSQRATPHRSRALSLFATRYPSYDG